MDSFEQDIYEFGLSDKERERERGRKNEKEF